MTFRHYRPDFAPRTSTSPPGYVGTPLCACGVPCTLRPDGRGRVRASLSTRSGLDASSRLASVPSGSGGSNAAREERCGAVSGANTAGDSKLPDQLFFWVCNAGASNEGKTCGHFRLLNMREEGRGDWFRQQADKRPSVAEQP